MPDNSPHRAPEEIEWQFDTPDLDRVKSCLQQWTAPDGTTIAIKAKPPVEQQDTYLDTDNWNFRRAGCSLRIRRKGRRAEATLKSISAPAEDALRRRLEFSEPLPASASVETLQGPVGERVRAVAGLLPVRPLFEIRTQRSAFDLRADGKVIAEVALDETLLVAPDKSHKELRSYSRSGAGAREPARLQRVEIESKSSGHPALKEWVGKLWEECALTPAGASKYESALVAMGLAPGKPPDLGSTAVLPSLSLGETAFAVMRQHLTRFMIHEPMARLGEDPESLHDLRVAARRIRAAIKLFEEYLPPRMQRLHEELGRAAHALGDARDLDVQIQQIEGAAASVSPREVAARTAILGALNERRKAARQRMLQALDSRRQDRVMRSLIRILSREAPADSPIAVAIAPDLIAKRYQKLRKAGREIGKKSPPVEYHEVRIRAKKLRYALEFFADLYGEPARRFINRLVTLQDLLGSHQDACVAAEQLKSLNEAQGQAMGPEACFLMGDLAAGYAAEAARKRDEFPKVFKALSKKQFKKLDAEMTREKRASLAALMKPAPAEGPPLAPSSQES